MLRKIEKPIERNLRPKWDELGFVCSTIRDAGIIFTGYELGQEPLINDLMDQDISCVVTYDLLDDSNINYVGFDNFKSAYEMGRLAAKVLLDAIDQEVRIPAQYCLDANLIVRNSCLELK